MAAAACCCLACWLDRPAGRLAAVAWLLTLSPERRARSRFVQRSASFPAFLRVVLRFPLGDHSWITHPCRLRRCLVGSVGTLRSVDCAAVRFAFFAFSPLSDTALVRLFHCVRVSISTRPHGLPCCCRVRFGHTVRCAFSPPRFAFFLLRVRSACPSSPSPSCSHVRAFHLHTTPCTPSSFPHSSGTPHLRSPPTSVLDIAFSPVTIRSLSGFACLH